MASNSGRKSGSSGRSSSRSRVVIGAEDTSRVRYPQAKQPAGSGRRATPRKVGEGERSRPNREVSAGRRVAGQKAIERDRRRREIAVRRTLVWVLGAAVVAGVVWGLVALWRAPLFKVDTVEVTGLSRLKQGDVIKLAAIPQDATLLRLPADQILRGTRSSPWVQSAELSRSFPNTLNISVVERTPVAFVDAQGAGLWLVSGDGFWLVQRTSESTKSIVTVRDAPNLHPVAGARVNSAEVTNALGVLKGISPQLKAQTKFVSAAAVEKTMLVLRNDIQVFFGPAEDVAKKDLIARDILGREKNIVYINVRVTDRPTWRGLNPAN